MLELDDLTIDPVAARDDRKGPFVVIHFTGRFVFLCRLTFKDGWALLREVRNVRYWAARDNGLGGFANDGPLLDDCLDDWPDTRVPLDKVGPILEINHDAWADYLGLDKGE